MGNRSVAGWAGVLAACSMYGSVLMAGTGLGGCATQPGVVERQGTVAVRTASAKRELSMSPERVREIYSDPAARAELRGEAVRLLVASTAGGDPQMRANAYEALELAPDALADRIAQGLTDENVGVRAIAAVSAGRAGLRGHEEALLAMLAENSGYTSASAEFALRMLGEEVEQGAIEDALLQIERPGVRGHAVFLAGELGDPAFVPLLKEAAARRMNRASMLEQRVVELQISEALVKLGDEGQLGPIRAALYPASPSDLEATALAVQITGELKDRAMRGRLAQLSEARGPTGETLPAEVQAAIAIAMAKLGDRDGWFIADQLWETERFNLRADAAAIYGLAGRAEDLPKLRAMLGDRVGLVRVAAAGALLRSLGGAGE